MLVMALIKATVCYADFNVNDMQNENNLASNNNIYGTGVNAVDKIIDTLKGIMSEVAELSCEGREVLKIYKGAMDHTCTPTPLANIFLNQLMAPNSTALLFRLSMNNKTLLGYDNCSVQNRADYYAPEVTFGLCVNKKLTVNKAIGMGQGIWAALGGAFSGKNMIDEYKAHASLKPEQIYDVITLKIPASSSNDPNKVLKQGPVTTVVDIPLALNLPYMPLKLVRQDDKVCVAVEGFSTASVGCKYTKEPYELSKYAGFMGESSQKIQKINQDNSLYAKVHDRTKNEMDCNSLHDCYSRSVQNSKTLLPISAPIINCVKQMLVRFLVNEKVCSFSDKDGLSGASASKDSAFFIFQQNLKRAVIAVLMLYVMINGVKIFLGGAANKEAIIMFIFKVVLVTYFSIGINLGKDGGTFSGMLDIIFPFLFQGTGEIASWMMSASPSTLCSFNSSDYSTGENLSLWDALDCRVSYYIGLNGFSDLYTTMRNTGTINPIDASDELSIIDSSIPPYLILLVPALIQAFFTGWWSLVALALSFPVLVVSIAAYIVQSFVVSLLLIVILGILAPLMVPMALFERTQSYFEGWWHTLMSFILQPAVSVVFSVMIFSIYDWGFYGTCKYKAINIVMPNNSILKSFFLDVEQADDNCKNTLGWFLSEKFDFGNIVSISIKDLNKAKATGSAGGVKAIKTPETLETKKSNSKQTAPVNGFFQIITSMLVACFCLYIGYQVSDQLAEFAAQMSGGISLKALTSSPKQNFSKIMSAINAAGGAAKSAGGAGGASAGAGGASAGAGGGAAGAGGGAVGGAGGAARGGAVGGAGGASAGAGGGAAGAGGASAGDAGGAEAGAGGAMRGSIGGDSLGSGAGADKNSGDIKMTVSGIDPKDPNAQTIAAAAAAYVYLSQGMGLNANHGQQSGHSPQASRLSSSGNGANTTTTPASSGNGANTTTTTTSSGNTSVNVSGVDPQNVNVSVDGRQIDKSSFSTHSSAHLDSSRSFTSIDDHIGQNINDRNNDASASQYSSDSGNVKVSVSGTDAQNIKVNVNGSEISPDNLQTDSGNDNRQEQRAKIDKNE